jgi:hypothetical protein
MEENKSIVNGNRPSSTTIISQQTSKEVKKIAQGESQRKQRKSYTYLHTSELERRSWNIVIGEALFSSESEALQSMGVNLSLSLSLSLMGGLEKPSVVDFKRRCKT